MDLNLLPDMAKFQVEKIKFSKKTTSLVVSILTVWVMALTILMVFYWTSKISFSKTEAKYKILEDDYKKMSEDVVINQRLRQKAKLISQILEERFEYGETFARMKSLFGDEVMIESMELDDKYNFSLTGSVIGNDLMDMVEERVNDISDGLIDGFLRAEIVSVLVENDKWSFGLEVVLK